MKRFPTLKASNKFVVIVARLQRAMFYLTISPAILTGLCCLSSSMTENSYFLKSLCYFILIRSMWNFPSIQAFTSNNFFFIFWVLLVLVFSAIAWSYVYSSIKHNTKESTGEYIKNVVIGAGTLLAVIFVSSILITEFYGITYCRNLDLNKVKAIRVKKMFDEHSFTNSTVLFNDSNKIQEGLRILTNAGNAERRKINGSREQFTKGYQIQVILEDNSPAPAIYYFSETDNFQKTNIIIPHCDLSSDEIKSTDDIYSSPNFGNWIRENIEPEFNKIQ